MEMTLNESGQLVDAEGKVFEVEGEAVTVTGAKRQDDVDRAFQAEKMKHKQKLDALNGRIKVLEDQTEKSAEVQRMLDEMKSEKEGLAAKLVDAEKAAEGKVASQLAAVEKRAKEAEEALLGARAAHLRESVSTCILGAAKDGFNDPAIDVVPHLLAAHKREPQKGSDGKDTGEFVDLFRMTFKNEKGEQVTEHLPVDKALEVWAVQHPHHVRASGQSGSGGANYNQSVSNRENQKGFTYPSMGDRK